MRSIRRSSITYLLLLLGLALASVGLLVDQFAREAIHARELAETQRIEQTYDIRRDTETKRITLEYADRRREVEAKLDAELLHEARRVLVKDLDRAMRPVLGRSNRSPEPRPPEPTVRPPARATRPPEPRPPELRPPEPMFRPTAREGQLFRLRERLLLIGNGPHPVPVALTAAVATDWLFRPSPVWLAYDVPRTVARLQEGFRKSFEEDEHARAPEAGRRPEDDEAFGVAQFDVVFTSPALPRRVIATIHPAWPGRQFQLDLDAFGRSPGSPQQVYDNVAGPSGAMYRRVIIAAGPRPFPIWLAGPPGSPNPPGPRGPFRPADLFIRSYVHHARPHTELTARLAEALQTRDEQLARLGTELQDRADQLAHVRTGTRAELAKLRTRLGLIGVGSFVALFVGGWVVVGRGMRPVGRLSEAVSRVSEKDFTLPHDGKDLPVELAPIHSRLTQTFDLLRRAFAREKQAVADISHELRTPIASLLATLDVALRKPRSPDQYRTTLEDCRAIAKQLSQLVERIMTLANLDSGNARTAVARTDAADLAEGCAAVIRPLAEANNLTFDVMTRGPLELDTDPDKLREVLINLLHNAVEYNRPGGRVELIGSRRNGHIVLEVRDTGIGMPAEVRERIFERFYRADVSRHATGVHAGLGLAIVKEYVERLGGSIAVESEADAGSTFRVELPALPKMLPVEPEEAATSNRPIRVG